MAKDEPAKAAERRCILTGERAGRADLIRLALGPDGAVLPDVAAKAPGRGAWLSPDRTLVEGAAARGKLRGALARAFKSNALKVPDDLADRIAAALERRTLDLLGLANKAGHLIWGSERISAALGAGQVRLLLHAADAQPDGCSKLDGKARAIGDVETLVLPVGRAELSMALGRENVVHAALGDAAAAARVGDAVVRWRAYIGLGTKTAEAADAVSEQIEVLDF